ncbi:lachesin [Penaeus vannamei]|uniref:Putative neurotrimin-like isoform X3 n=1 Tax=Penaeus vannamei TaxID=6689 RepID=A0A423U958_PENVA|nr:lachesin-like [Penaeus vannamei]ROT85235.1 putative neurotrimin-like isoform X3 [Penaeus vannamei]
MERMAGTAEHHSICPILVRLWLLFTIFHHAQGVKPRDPSFLSEIQNMTVSEGRTVKFACRVDNLGIHKVAWIHYENSAILTVSNHVITRNERITVSHDKHQKTWYLHISDVRETDTGKYMCQINTASAMTIAGFLTVVVPPDIVDNESTGDVIAQEGNDIKLRCRARGSPRPTVIWKREDGESITVNKSTTVTEYQGEVLRLSKVSRMDMGPYLCIASNGHPPTVSKRILVSVDFPPMLWIPHQLIGAAQGQTVVLECFTEAHPTSLNYWTRGDGNMIYDSEKYHIENREGNPDYKIHMLLTVRYLEPQDFGTYRCVAKNPRGETDGTIKIYDSGPPPTSALPLTTEAEMFEKINNQVWDKSENRTHKRPNPQAVSGKDGEEEEIYATNEERSLNLPAVDESSAASRALCSLHLSLLLVAALLRGRLF